MIVPGLLTASCSRVVKLGVAMIRFSLDSGSSLWLEARESWRSRGLRCFTCSKNYCRLLSITIIIISNLMPHIIHALCSMSTPYFVHCVVHAAWYSSAHDSVSIRQAARETRLDCLQVGEGVGHPSKRAQQVRKQPSAGDIAGNV